MRAKQPHIFGALVMGILITIGGCADAPTHVAEPAEGFQHAARVTSKAPPAVGSWRVIGPAGGEIRTGDHRIVFPAGAVTRPVLIGARPMEGYAGVEFSPHGLVFSPGAQPELTLSLAGAELTPGSSLAIAYQAPSGVVEEVFEAVRSPDGTSLTTRVPHFSGYIAIVR